MMRYNFSYPNILGLEIPDQYATYIYEVKIAVHNENSFELIQNSIRNPIGMERFSKVLNLDSKVLIIINDISRPTPAHLLYPPLLEEIHASGVKIPHVKLLIAVRTYRPMTAEEIICKVGQEVAQKYVIMNHEWDNPEALHDYGQLEDGTKIILNKQMALADFVIGVGSIALHPTAGFSGGGKIVAPGVACKSICRSLCKEVWEEGG